MKREKKIKIYIAVIFAIAIAIVFLSPSFMENIENTDIKEAPLYQPVIDYENAVIEAVEAANQSVVSIAITKDIPILENCSNPFGNLPPEFEFFFGDRFEQYTECEEGTRSTEIGGGSGFIVSSDGLIATNKHVVSDEEAEYTVFTNSGNQYEAQVIARDPIEDIAFIKIETDEDLQPAKLGDSNSIKLGQTAIAIGNALGEFRNTVSVGVISGLSRDITASDTFGSFVEQIRDVIQTDAAINQGNSGGPLINLKGEVVGVNTAVAQNAQNIGFAIPINQVKRGLTQIQETGEIQVPFLGVRYINLTPEFAEQNDIETEWGALVRGGQDGPAVVPNSPADKAGIQAEDIIIEINNQEINRENSLADIIVQQELNKSITLKVIRRGEEIELQTTLEGRSDF
ncbi:MAG: trypsin-like peptidase domain-containing protein [Candidatus Paceibacterota bacterium]